MEFSHKHVAAQSPEERPERYSLLFLGRKPTRGERSADPADAEILIESLVQSPEYRGRFRDAALTDENARAAVALWPPETREYDLHIVIVTGGPWSKASMGLETLAPQLGPRLFLTLLCGEEDTRPFPAYSRTEALTFPGESVFQLRARLPMVLKESVWVSVLEDHSIPTVGWLPAVQRVIAASLPDTMAFNGTAANETSTAPWAWANFLFNFVYHWHPSASSELNGTVATIFFRRDLLGARPLRVHEYEEFILGRKVEVHGDIRVNHTQHVGWWQATTHVFDNGCVAGNSIRRNSNSPRTTLLAMVRWVCGGRLRDISAVLKKHPRYHELPRGIMARLRWISFCHSAGALTGSLIGSGRAEKRLE